MDRAKKVVRANGKDFRAGVTAVEDQAKTGKDIPSYVIVDNEVDRKTKEEARTTASNV